MHSLFEPLESEARTGHAAAPVVLAVALDQTYDYLVPEDVTLEPGCFVLVPFGPQSRIGVVWDKPVGDTGKAVDPQEAERPSPRVSTFRRCRSSRCALPSGSRATRWRRSA